MQNDSSIVVSESLQHFLQESNVYETEESLKLKKQILEELNVIISAFILKVKGNTDTPQEEYKGKIIPSGSYFLGVSNPDSDLDLLCVCPQFVRINEHFFVILYKMLAEDRNVKNLLKIEDSFIPILKFSYRGVDIDMSFAALPLNSIPDDIDILDNSILENISTVSVRSLNGPRVGYMIHKLVPNVEQFRCLLRILRIWASRRMIYGNAFGYFGGVNLAILAAYICKEYPNEGVDMLVFRFYNLFQNWPWPNPVYINMPDTGSLPSWESSTSRDLMPIITPAYPAINSMYSASNSTREIMKNEFKRAALLVENILLEKSKWSELFAPSSFLTEFKQFIEIMFSADSDVEFDMWKGFVSSKIRKLMIFFENTNHVDLAPVYPEIFIHPDNHHCANIYLGIKATVPKDQSINLNDPSAKFLAEVYSNALRPLSSKISLKVMKSDQLPSFIFPNGVKPKITKKKTTKSRRKDQ